jgi:hypothetical protein
VRDVAAPRAGRGRSGRARRSVVQAREIGEARIWLMADRATTANAAGAQATLRRDRLSQLALAVRTSAFVASSCLSLDELSLWARHPSHPSPPPCVVAHGRKRDRPGERSCQHRTTERNAVGLFSGPPATAFRDNQNSGENLKARACRPFGAAIDMARCVRGPQLAGAGPPPRVAAPAVVTDPVSFQLSTDPRLAGTQASRCWWHGHVRVRRRARRAVARTAQALPGPALGGSPLARRAVARPPAPHRRRRRTARQLAATRSGGQLALAGG